MRRAVTAVAAACLLCAPTVLAFFSGGYFDTARLVAAVAACAFVVLGALLGRVPPRDGSSPRSRWAARWRSATGSRAAWRRGSSSSPRAGPRTAGSSSP